MPTPKPDPLSSETASKATGLQLVRLMKLLGIDQATIAQRIGVTPPLVSRWLTEPREPHPRHHAALLEWASVAYEDACKRHHKDVQALPTEALRVAAIEAFHAPLNQWSLQVLYEAGVLEKRFAILKEELRTLLAQEAFTADEYHAIGALAAALSTQAYVLKVMQPSTAGTDSEEGP